MSFKSQPLPRLRTRTLALARQMDWFRGLRAAVALCAPLVLGGLAGNPNLGWAARGGRARSRALWPVPRLIALMGARDAGRWR